MDRSTAQKSLLVGLLLFFPTCFLFRMRLKKLWKNASQRGEALMARLIKSSTDMFIYHLTGGGSL